MERIIDYLAVEEAKAAKRTLKAQKKERIAKLLKKITPPQPVVVDFLALMGD